MTILLLALLIGTTTAQAIPAAQGTLPANGENGALGGIFGMGSGASGVDMPNPLNLLAQGPKAEPMVRDSSGGSGPYKASYTTSPSLPGHTIYAPINPPATKLPAIVFGEGGCISLGTMFSNFLTEIASHGFMVVANGNPTGFAFTKTSDLTKGIDWVTSGAANGKFGTPDVEKIAAMGQSCGGLEAYSASYRDPRVKLTVLLNSGLLDQGKSYLLKELAAPVAFILGGPTDIAYKNGERDYASFNSNLPVFKANLDTGHMGTYAAKQGGQFGKMAVALLKARFYDDKASKDLLTNANSPLVKAGWEIVSRNWF